ncbi:MAG: hypothetical protein RSF69_06230 [Erysipelotrichaceae bacterium]
MKKFLITISVSFMLIFVGMTTILFELKDFEFVSHEYKAPFETKEITLLNEENFIIENVEQQNIKWVINNEMKNKLVIKINPFLSTEVRHNYLKIKGASFKGIDMLNYFIDGLKNKKIYLSKNIMNDSIIIIETSDECASRVIVSGE